MKRVKGLVISLGVAGVLALSATPAFAMGGQASNAAASPAHVDTQTYSAPNCPPGQLAYPPNQTWNSGAWGPTAHLTLTPIHTSAIRSVLITTYTGPSTEVAATGVTVVCINLPVATVVAATPHVSAWTWPFTAQESVTLCLLLVAMGLVFWFKAELEAKRRKS